jgi:hypothetical protein
VATRKKRRRPTRRWPTFALLISYAPSTDKTATDFYVAVVLTYTQNLAIKFFLTSKY